MVQEAGTGKTLHTKAVGLTVLLPPSPPTIHPPSPVAIEGDNHSNNNNNNLTLTFPRQTPEPDLLQQWRVSSSTDPVVQVSAVLSDQCVQCITYHRNGREGSDQVLESRLVLGATRDQASTSSLTISPHKNTDGAVFR